MNVETSIGAPVDARLLANYFRTLVNQVYKILPMRESGQQSLSKYVWRLEAELLGCNDLFPSVREDSYFASLLGILHFLSESIEDCQPQKVKQLVFEAISLCGKLRDRYAVNKEGEL